jgi:transposase
MAQPISRAVRERIVGRRERGESVSQVAQAEGVSGRSIRRIYSAWQQQGESALLTGYRQSANTAIQFDPGMYRQAVTMKRNHASWGAGLIRVELQIRYGAQPLPAERTLQVWFCREHLNHVAHRMARVFQGRGQAVHEVWEMDAKDHIYLGDRSPTCVVSVQDEYSGAVLSARPFPPGGLATGAGRSDPALAAADL